MADELGEKLFDLLKKKLSVCKRNNSFTEAIIRCPYCGDSEKNIRDGHLYIKLKEPFPFFCQRCNTDGLFGPTALKDLSIYNSEISTELYKVGKNCKYNIGKKSHTVNLHKKKFQLPAPSENFQNKMDYLNERIGMNITAKEAVTSYKTIFSIEDYLSLNEINFVTEEESVLEKLEKYGIGFLSADQTFINFRSTVDPNKSGFRYHMYSIFEPSEESKRFYTINSQIDLMNPVLNVHVAEGVLDIVGVHQHLFNGKFLKDHVFMAVNGKGFNRIFQYLSRLGFLNLNVEIYSDADVNLNFYKYMKTESILLKDTRIKVLYNKLEKDYGVHADKINTREVII
jgi:hypothetical protein